jgi:hypothetical protein
MTALFVVLPTIAFGLAGPFRSPTFEKTVVLKKDGERCVTQLHGTWPNLPHNPAEWLVGGRTDLIVDVYTPNGKGRYDAKEIDVYYQWPDKRYRVSIKYSGHVEFKENKFTLELYKDPSEKQKTRAEFYENGSYIISNVDGCS